MAHVSNVWNWSRFGQWVHFTATRDPQPDSVERFYNESHRPSKAGEGHLKNQPYFVQAFSIADGSVYPWIQAALERELLALKAYPALGEWIERMKVKPSEQRGMKVP